MKESILPVNLEPRENVELESLRRTRAALRAKTVNVALAVFFTTMVFCATPVRHPVAEMLQQAGTWPAIVLLLAGAYFWWRFVRACKDLRGTGLPPPQGIGPRLAWMACGWLIFESVAAILSGWTGRYFYFQVVGAAIALGLGEKLRQVVPSSELTDVQTLFTPTDDDDQANG